MIKKWQEEEEQVLEEVLALGPGGEWVIPIHSAGTSHGFPDGGGEERMGR